MLVLLLLETLFAAPSLKTNLVKIYLENWITCISSYSYPEDTIDIGSQDRGKRFVSEVNLNLIGNG